MHQPGPFVATASVQTAVTAPALAEFVKELDGMVGGGRHRRRSWNSAAVHHPRLPGLFETPTQLAAQLETLFAYRLPDDFFNTYLSRRSTRSRADDVSATAKKYLKAGSLTIVVVGDRTKIEAGLRELPVGQDLKVLRFDADFRLAPAEE